jgi:hypothetical protein
MIGIPVALVYFNGGEWLIHKYVLHGAGRNKKNFWSFHWHEHHRHARQNDFRDEDYERPLLRWHAQGKEALGLALVTAAHLPLFPVAPFFTATICYSTWNYFRVHKRAHLDPEWGKQNLPWHYDHHMGPDQDANWGVTKPWFDVLLGTRKPYLGTERATPARKQRRVASAA